MERIAVAYELRFAHYVRVATAIAGCLAYREDGPLAAHRTLCGRLEPVAA